MVRHKCQLGQRLKGGVSGFPGPCRAETEEPGAGAGLSALLWTLCSPIDWRLPCLPSLPPALPLRGVHV